MTAVIAPVTFQRLLTRGDLPESDGGLYNPSVVAGPDGHLRMLVRREADYTWKRPSFPTFVDCQTRAHETLRPIGFQPGARIEDCRVFAWRGSLLVSHVDYLCPDGRVAYPVKQRLSVIDGDQLLPWDAWNLPVSTKRVEKNWVLVSTADDLFCVYSLDPFVVCRRVRTGAWEMLYGYCSGLTKAFGKEPHNSTHLLPFDGGFLGFWHFIKPGTRSVYVTGAYWLGPDLKLAMVSGALLDGGWVANDVYKPGVYYVSSAIVQGAEVKLFAGEGDAHCSVATLPVETLRAELRPHGLG